MRIKQAHQALWEGLDKILEFQCGSDPAAGRPLILRDSGWGPSLCTMDLASSSGYATIQGHMELHEDL